MTDSSAASAETRALRAAFKVERNGPHLAITLASRGGRGRNPDYNERLHQILERLAGASAAISEISVQSTEVAKLAADQRRLSIAGYSYPIQMAESADLRDLRLAIGRAQEPVGQAPGASGGNRTKKIRLTVALPKELAALPLNQWERYLAGAESLTGRPIPRSGGGEDHPPTNEGRGPEHALAMLSARQEIARANREFMTKLRDGARSEGRMALGFRGGQVEADVFYREDLGIWIASEELENRSWHAFGLGTPRASNSIVIEINLPAEGINRRISGGFAADRAGELYVIHRGRVGGGRQGIGKREFLAYYSRMGGALEIVQDGDGTSGVLVLGALHDDRLPALIAAFIRTVEEFKALTLGRGGPPTLGSVGGSEPDKPLQVPATFSPEFEGRKEYSTRERIEAECTHGTVVNTLQRVLRERGHGAINDQHRDLMLLDGGGRTRILFEVKPSTQSYAIYQAIGQLLFHTAHDPAVVKVAVLPASASGDLRERLAKIGIALVGFTWEGQQLNFHGLDELGC